MDMVVLEFYGFEGMSNLCFDVVADVRHLRAPHTSHVLCRKAHGKIQTPFWSVKNNINQPTMTWLRTSGAREAVWHAIVFMHLV